MSAFLAEEGSANGQTAGLGCGRQPFCPAIPGAGDLRWANFANHPTKTLQNGFIRVQKSLGGEAP
jgi:hypothetical protein